MKFGDYEEAKEALQGRVGVKQSEMKKEKSRRMRIEKCTIRFGGK